ncbi:MAG TPA: hypothetical protein VIJ11_11535, partial [Galbitalea sp.]
GRKGGASGGVIDRASDYELHRGFVRELRPRGAVVGLSGLLKSASRPVRRVRVPGSLVVEGIRWRSRPMDAALVAAGNRARIT